MGKVDTPAVVVVCDAGPLIHLDELDSLPLLKDFSEVLVPQAVWDEVLRHRPQALQHEEIELSCVTPRESVAPDLEAVSRLFPLHEGETQALQLVRERQTDLLLTDDTAARLAAKNLGIPVHGSIGILVRAIRRGQRSPTDIAVLLKALPERSTLHVKPSLLQEIIRQIEEL